MTQAKIVQTVVLSRPAQAHGEEITRLQFREPNADDAMACGFPLKFYGDGAMKLSMPEATALAARLASVPLSTIKALPLADLMAVVGVITGFFGMEEQEQEQAADATSSPAPSTSPGSGDVIPPPSLHSA